MRAVAMLFILSLGACSAFNNNFNAEQDFHKQQSHFEYMYAKIYAEYDPDYVYYCLYYEDLVCEFE